MVLYQYSNTSTELAIPCDKATDLFLSWSEALG